MSDEVPSISLGARFLCKTGSAREVDYGSVRVVLIGTREINVKLRVIISADMKNVINEPF